MARVSLEHRTAVVTGAASGIGRALAGALAAEGCHLALADLDGEGLIPCAEELAADGRRISTHVVDVADADAMQRFVDEVIAQHEGVHLVVNNAGMVTLGTVADQSLAQLRRVVDVNLWGTVAGCKLFLPHLQQQEWAWIVNLSSVMGLIGVGSLSSYCTSKFAVLGFSEALREELLDSPVGVTCVLPGAVDTGIIRGADRQHEGSFADVKAFFAREGIRPEVVADRIVTAVRKGHERVLITPKAYGIDWIKRLSPVAGGRFLAGNFERQTGLGGWRQQEGDGD